MADFAHSSHDLRLSDRSILPLGRRPVVMGILNVTPDSFSDAGQNYTVEAALFRARQMRAEGAAIIDVGGESTRPGAEPVSAAEELARVIPVVEALRRSGIAQPISVDTTKAEVAARAIEAGASMINDVSGLRRDPEMAAVVAQYRVPVVIMHWDLQRDPAVRIMTSVQRYFEVSVGLAEAAGIARDRIVLDPGFGFAKTLAENYRILRELATLRDFGLPLLAGTSRKSMIGNVLDAPADQRLAGTLATTTIAYCAGAHIFRVHDVRPNIEALRVAEATLYGPGT